MALQVTLIKSPGKIAEPGTSKTVHTFDSNGGTLGRSSSNTWVLADPDRFLSSCHCEIVSTDNQFFIVDLSTNGTFVNGSPEPLGKGVKAPLQDGDGFEIGDYRFSVKVVAAQSGVASSPFGPSTGDPLFDDCSGVGSSPFADPFAPSAPLADELSLSPNSENADPLLALDMAGRSSESETGGFFDTNSQVRTSDPFAGMGQVDLSPAMDQAVSWPDSKGQNLIPDNWEDDWEDDLLGPAPGSPSSPSREPVERAPSPPAPELVAPEIASPTDSPVPTPIVSRPNSTDVPLDRMPPATPMSNPVVAPEMRRTPTTAPTTGGNADRKLVTAMGLNADALSDEQVNAINEKAGLLMREIVEGMMQVLRSRTSIKNEFRMNVTTIEPFENNPLKFSVGVDEALENMFIKKSKAYKEPLEAFRESFQEIGEHQLAMIAGIRLGFEKMMSRFDPEVLQELFTKQGKGSALPGVQKAKYWASYCDYYSGFSENMESSFQNLFGSDFVQAYEDQLRKIGAARKKRHKAGLPE